MSAVPALVPPPFEPIRPTPEQVDTRLRQILSRGSAVVGEQASLDRLMIMFTRSCDLRCSYCMVGLTEEAFDTDHPGTPDPAVFAGDVPTPPLGDMSTGTLHRSMDWLMTSTRRQLEVQMFGGEPARRWDELVDAMRYAVGHPARGDRPITFLFTTNGVQLSPERLAEIADLPVMIQFSLDGDRHGSRFRRGHLLDLTEALDAMQRAVGWLQDSEVDWFMNATLPPTAAGEVMDRYAWARDMGVPALQLNYATGMHWRPEQVTAFLDGTQAMLHHHHADPGGLRLFNWQNQADPVPLCGDIIVDVDSRIYQVGALFHERRYPTFKSTYELGDLTVPPPFTGTRLSLLQLWDRTKQALAHDPKGLQTFLNNIRLGAAFDLVTRATATRLGRSAA